MSAVREPILDTREQLLRELRTCRTFAYPEVMARAADQLEAAWSAERNVEVHIQNLLEANNAYLEDGRAARRERDDLRLALLAAARMGGKLAEEVMKLLHDKPNGGQ